MSRKISIAVVGAGIIGTSTALCVLESGFDVDLTLMAEKFSPSTTGDGSAGSLFPSTLGPETSQSDISTWFRETYKFLLKYAKSPDADNYGVGMVSGYALYKTPLEDRNPIYSLGEGDKKIFLNFRTLEENELKFFGDRFKSGYFYTTVYAECKKLIPVLMKSIQELGGKIVHRKIESLTELSENFDVVINCTGLGARKLVPDDPTPVYPIRGQVMRVKANWVKHMILSPDEGSYIIPNGDEIILGGTKQYHDDYPNVRESDREHILKGCYSLVPSLKNAVHVREWVGFRPGRVKPRIELEMLNIRSLEASSNLKTAINRSRVIIHNYGHGGSGVTLFWGCALQVGKLLEDYAASLRLESKF